MAHDYTPEQMQSILDALTVPFEPKDVKWRVITKTKDEKKGCVAPYADPRAYASRLNDVLTPAGWSCELKAETTTGLTRMRQGKSVPTGKVSVIATLEIFGISKKSSTGEMWADDDNALTRAEAQAMKRAASMFGVGKYFYELKNLGNQLWVPLDERGNPTQVPTLPQWALPASAKQSTNRQQQSQQPVNRSSEQRPTQQGPQRAQAQPSQSAESQFNANRESGQRFLGVALVDNILSQLSDKLDGGQITGDKYVLANQKLGEATTLLTDVRAAAAEIHLSVLDGILAQYQVKDLNNIPTYQVLYRVAMDLKVVPLLARRAA